jgi:hypothetical protein
VAKGYCSKLQLKLPAHCAQFAVRGNEKIRINPTFGGYMAMRRERKVRLASELLFLTAVKETKENSNREFHLSELTGRQFENGFKHPSRQLPRKT